VLGVFGPGFGGVDHDAQVVGGDYQRVAGHRDDRWAHLRGGAFVVKNKEGEVESFANDPLREARLWAATADLLNSVTG
jgi:hypothetical protein